MRFEVHFDLPDGTSDMVIVSGQSIEEIREKAYKEIAARGGRDAWSREIEPQP